MTNPDRSELVKLDETGLDAAVRECARITAPEISDDEYERIKTDNSPRYQNTRTEMTRAIRAYLRAANPALSSIVTCCVTGAIPGDGGACGDCDPCLLGEASVPAPVKTLIAEKNSLIHRVGELEDELDSLRRLASSEGGGVKGEPEPVALSASERACYLWPDDTEQARACRAAYIDGAKDYTAPPADAGMREALDKRVKFDECSTPEPSLRQVIRSWYDHISDPALAQTYTDRFIEALTAPGATTKSDGGNTPIAHTIAMPEYRYQELDTRGGNVSFGNYSEYTPVTVRGSTSDPSSTRSDVTVEEYERAIVAWADGEEIELTIRQVHALARALLETRQIRRK